MNCSDCGSTTHGGLTEGLVLECAKCGYQGHTNCPCRLEVAPTPGRWVHCQKCDERFKKKVSAYHSQRPDEV